MVDRMLAVAAGLACIPVTTLALEFASALMLKKKGAQKLEQPRVARIAVLIPAHNEEAGILATIEDLKKQLRSSDRLLVIADNCTDSTADIARAAGAEVTERRDPERRGKGYALDWGVRHLRQDPPDVVIIVDADCRMSERALDILALTSFETGRPAQAKYVMTMPAGQERGGWVHEFAWALKCQVRPLGLFKLGLPCQLMGTGMAFTWKAISSVDIASGNLVEDVKLGLDLADRGLAPRLCPSACVESTFAPSEPGIITQRRRWETGSIRMLFTDGPRFLWRAIRTHNLQLLVLALDVMVPPLSFLLGGIGILFVAALATAIMGYGLVPLAISTSAGAIIGLSLLMAWLQYGRRNLQAKDVWALSGFLIQKAKIHWRRPGRTSEWIRTDRS